jgi:8-oxo-dGTP diphosphatase
MPSLNEPVHVVGAILLKDDKILIARRASHKSSPGLWEFPGGKVEPGEDSARALVRELWEELELEIEPLTTFDVSETLVASLWIRLEVMVCLIRGDFKGKSSDHDSFMWVSASELESLQWPTPDLQAVRRLAKLKSLTSLVKSL